jgi:hypothetical protein
MHAEFGLVGVGSWHSSQAHHMGRLVGDKCLILLTQSTILSLVLVNLYSTRTFGLTPKKMLKATVLEPTRYTSPELMLHSVVLVMKRPPIHTETLSPARRGNSDVLRAFACMHGAHDHAP